jgi:hypothetical protein
MKKNKNHVFMIEKLKEAKDIKLKELREIEAKIEAEKNKEFQYLIGKFVRLATTCVIRVDEIEYCDNYHIHVLGVKVLTCNNELRIEIGGAESLHKSGKPTIITKEQFLDFMRQSVASFESKVLDALDYSC